MLTVTVDWVASGNSSTRRPLASLYSSMPSNDRTFSACAIGAGAGGVTAGGSGLRSTTGSATGSVPGLLGPLHAAKAVAATARTKERIGIMGPRWTALYQRGPEGDSPAQFFIR